MFTQFQIVTALLLGAAVFAFIAYAKGHSDGRSYEQVRAMEVAIERLQERGLINEEVNSLDSDALLRELCPDCVSDNSAN